MKQTLHRILGCIVAALLAAAPAMAGSIAVTVELERAPASVWAAERAALGTRPSVDEIEAYRDELRRDQDELLADLDGLGVAYTRSTAEVPHYDGGSTTVEHRYTLVFNGITLFVDRSGFEALEAHPEVAAVRPVRKLELSLDRSVSYVRAPEVYGEVAELTAFDDFREGFEGQGIHVAVIDSGIDWSHEMFGGDPSPPRLGVAPETASADTHEKVIYYLPLVDGVADDFGHGTHVSATAAGYLGFAPGLDGVPLTDDDVPVHGVAPQAKLMGYKACNAAGVCLTNDILLALEDAVSPRTLTGQPKPVAHVINLSLGGSGGPDDETAVAASNAALAGAVVVAAAGNDGPGEDTLGSPAAGRHVIAVAAATDSGVFPNSIRVLDPGGSPVPEIDPLPAFLAPDSNATQPIAEPIESRYVYAGLADTPDQVPLEVAGNVCLVIRGSTVDAGAAGSGLFANKATQCSAKGAIAMVLFNDGPGEMGPILAPAAIPVLTLSGEAGLFLRDELGFDETGISNHPIRITPVEPSLYEPEIAGFSSRGPVIGLGQVKPDTSAPGVDVLAATTFFGAPAASMQDPTRYTSASGTSMATPHTAGAAALVRQAHPGWTPDLVRAALVNTSTNQREADGSPEPDGAATDDLKEQGGGLIDVAAAVSTPGLLGVAGDGIAAPGLLPSHSFGALRVFDTLTVNGDEVEVTLADVSGAGGTYDLSWADNRHLDVDGVEVTVAPARVTVPAGGTATTTLSISVDGSRARGFEASRDLQGFLVAAETGGATVRMPFFLRATPSQPLPPATGFRTGTFEGSLVAGTPFVVLGDLEDLTWTDVPVAIGRDAVDVEATLDFDDLAADLDLVVYDPTGSEVARSENAGGPETVRFASTWPGTYRFRVIGWLNGPTDFTLEVTEEVAAPPAVDEIPGDFTGADGLAVDFDGDVTVTWSPRGNETGFEIDHLAPGDTWETVATVDAEATSVSFSALPDGDHAFRVKGITPGRTGSFVTPASPEVSVVVDRRHRVNITRRVETALSGASFADGVFRLDLGMTNTSDRSFLPLVELWVVRIRSASGTVEVVNADNGGSGTKRSDAALFDYSHELGADEIFSPGETTGSRTLELADPAAEMFTFRVVVTGHVGDPTVAADDDTGGDAGSGSAEDGDLLDSLTEVLQVTVDPLTGSTVVDLVDL